MSNLKANILGGPSNMPAPVLATSHGSDVKATQAGRIRSPILFLVDVSGSTTEGPNPDLPEIESALTTMIALMRQPSATNPLAANASTVDVAIVTYNEAPHLLQPWEEANKLNPLPKLEGKGGTATGTALLSSLDYLLRRIRHYDTAHAQPIPKSIPHIFHFTDGAPTDVAMDDDKWQAVQQLMTQVSGDKDKPFSMISHFVAPNGMVPGNTHLKDELGNAMSGYDALARWMGGDCVYELKLAPGMFDTLIKVIVKSVGGASKQEGRINDLLQKYNAPLIRNPNSILSGKPKRTGTDG